MKMFNVTFNKTGEYGDMYDITDEAVLPADNIEDIVSYVMENYMSDATRSENGRIITLSREVDGYPSYYMHDILIHEVNIKPLTEKVSYLG